MEVLAAVSQTRLTAVSCFMALNDLKNNNLLMQRGT